MTPPQPSPDQTINSSTWAHSTPSSTDPTCSSATYNTAGSSENSHSITSADNDEYICFMVKSALGVPGYKKHQVDYNPPTVSITQNGSTLTATSSASDLPTTPDWKHSGPLNSSPTCSGATYSGSGSTITGATNQKYYCFRVTDKAGNHGYGSILVNLSAPTLTLTQNNTTVTATGTGLTGFAYFKSSSDPTCDATNTSSTYTSGASATSMTNDQWVCFKAKNSLGVYGYAELEVDLTAPVITISQDQDSVDGSATVSGSTINSSTWAHSTPSSTDPTCSSATYNTAGSSENTHSITSADNDEYICFQVKSSLGVPGYKKYQIDYNPPTVSITQNGSTLTATSTASDLPTTPDWKSSGPISSSPTCSGATYSGSGNTITGATDQKYYCFRVTDKAGNHGYGSILVNLSAPTITLTQNNTTVTATGTSLTAFAYFDNGTTDPTCDATNTTATWTTGTSATALDDNDWVCFRAKNSLGVYGYGKIEVDLTAPVITITQDQDSVDATATVSGSTINSSTWAHSTPSSTDPTCSSATYNTAGSSENSHSITSADNDEYICFMVKSALGVPGYKKYQVDYNPPTVSITQNGSTLTATSSASDLPTTPDWKHSGPLNSSPTCSGATYSGSGSTITGATNQKYYCFRVTDKAGNHGYGSILVNLSAPTLTLTQNNTTVTATGTGLTGFAYFKSSSDPTCDATNTSSTYTSGASATSMTNDQWVCFKAKNSLGVYGYAELEVDLTAPVITISQDQDSVDGSATVSGSTINSSTWAHSTPSSTDPTCSSATYNTAGSSENTHSITSADNDEYICFQVKSSLGVPGYKKYQIDYNPPTVSITQNGSTLTATSTASDLPTTPDWKSSGPISSSPTCSGATYSGSGNTITGATDQKYYCFRVTDKAGNHGYGSILVNLSAPTITLTQNNTTVTATGTSLTAFAYFDNGTTDPTCDATNTTATWTTGTSATALDDNDWVCFRAKNSLGVYGYGKIEVDLTAPVITITQDQDSVDATATVSGSTINSSTWAHSTPSSTDPTCSSATYNTAGSSENSHSITSADNDEYICFQVKSSLGVPGYKKHQVDYNPPTVSITQNGSTLTATSSASDLPTTPDWKHSGPLNSSPTCSGATYSGSGSTITGATDQKYYCFRVTDKAGNHGYGSILVNLSAPTLTLTQNNTTVTATGTGLTGFAYFKSSSDPTCDATNTSSTYTSGASATSMTNDQWVCFKAKNSLGVYGYAELEVDLTAPVITISQDQDSVDAAATMAGSATIVSTTWAHTTLSATDPTCSSATYNTAGSSENTVSITSTDNNKYVCFRVKNSVGVFAYKKWTVDYNPPVVSVAQSGSTLTATSSASDLPTTPDWKSSGPISSSPTCSGATYSGSGNTITGATDQKYYCFRVTDKAGNHGYGSILVNLSAPTLTLTQNNTTVTATGTGLTAFAYFDNGTTDPTCDSTKTTGWTTGTSATSLDDNDWVCFKAKNSLGVYGYAELEVDLTAPVIILSQDQDSVDATATMAGSATIVSTTWAHTTLSATDPTCSSTTYNTAGSSENTISITSTDNNKYVCFRVKNSVGVFAYKKWTVDYNPPSVSVSQNGSTLTATSNASDLPTTPDWKSSGPHNSNPTCFSATFSGSPAIRP